MKLDKTHTFNYIIGGLIAVAVFYAINNLFKNMKKSTMDEPAKPYMPQVEQGTPEEQKALHDSLIKSMPNNFTLKLSADSNVNYFKNSNNEFYKQPYSTTGISGVQPIKISLAEYSDAYVKFKNN
jgi:hypothetical protein